MRILILGVGDAFTRRHFGSSALVQAKAGCVLIDCPDLIHRALHDATSRAGWNIDVSGIHDIILTHLHGDHCNGLESFGFFRRMLRVRDASSPRPRLHVSQPAAERLWERLAPAMHAPMGGAGGGAGASSTLEDFFEVRVLDPSRPSSIAGLQVQCRFTKHSIPTIGVVLADGPRKFGWSADTPFESGHVDWLNQAEVFVHESNLGISHTPIESLNGLPEKTRRKIRLIHLPDDFDARCTDMKILREGDVLDLSSI